MKLSAAVLLALGILLMAAAFFYPMVFGTESNWSEEQAAELAAIGQVAHNSEHEHALAHANHSSSEDEQPTDVMEKFQRLQAELDAARERPLRIAGMLKWLGVALTVLGAGLYYAGGSS